MKTRISARLLWTLVIPLALQCPAWAGPLGGSVVFGSASISGTAGSLTINQLSSQAIIDWASFNIGSGESTTFRFLGPAGSGSAVLNEVSVNAGPSFINGLLNSFVGSGNKIGGSVYIYNPNGLIIGSQGSINVGSFTGTTLSINDAAFLRGGNLTLGSGNLSLDSTASIQNQGHINALGGDIFLVAHQVENNGTLTANHVGLAAGSYVEIKQDGIPGAEQISVLAASPSSPGTTGVLNSASGVIQAVTTELQAAGGNVYALAINNAGAIRADALVNQGGHIYLTANGGAVQNSGTLDVSDTAAGGKGGTIEVTGSQVTLTGTSVINANGDTGGGTVLIGGGSRGKNPAVPDATDTTVDAGATITADAITRGNGGQVVVWSDDTTVFAGQISARGGAVGGNGGSAEVSAAQTLDITGHANLLAPHGTTGDLLLDPGSVDIVSGGNTGSEYANGTTGQITDGWVNNQLTTSSLSISTSDAGANGANAPTLTVDMGAAISWNTSSSLSLTGGNSVIVNGTITSTGSGGLTLTSPNGNIALNNTVSIGGGVSMTAATGININAPLTLTGTASSLTLNADSGNSGAGDLTVAAAIDTSAANAPVNITAADVYLTAGTIKSGSGVVSITASANGSIGLGYDSGALTLDNADLVNITTSGGLTLSTTGGANVLVGGATAPNVTGLLTINAPGGTVTFDTLASSFTSLNVASAAGVTLAQNVTTTGPQTYNEPVTLYGGGTWTLTGTGIDFASTLDAPNGAGLVVADFGATTFGGAVGGSHPLGTLTTSGTGVTLDDNVTTYGGQTYHDPVTLGGAAGGTVTLSGVNVDFANTVSSAANQSLDVADGGITLLQGNVNTGSGGQTYGGAVSLYGGGTFTLTGTGIDFASTIVAPNGASLSVVDSGSTTFGGAVGAGAGNALSTLTTSGTGVTIEGNVTTYGAQTYHDPVTLYGGGTLTLTGAGIDFANTVTSPNWASLVVADGGTTQLGGNVNTGNGSQTYQGPVSLNANVTLSGGSVDFGSTVNGAYNLTINGVTTLGGAVGNSAALTSLTLDGAATLEGPTITTTGAQNYDGAVTLYGGGTFTLTGTGVDFASTLDAPNRASLVVADFGATTFGGAVGGNNALGALTTSGTGVTLEGSVTTAGAQTYHDAVTLYGGGTLTLSGTGIDFASTVNAPNGASLVVADNGTTQLGGNVTTGPGAQTYDGPVSLNADAILSGGSVDFASTVNGAYNLTINGVTTLGGAVGNSAALTSLTLDGAATLEGPTITTTGAQNYDGAVTLYGGGIYTLTGTGIDFASTLDAPNRASLVVADFGATTFGGAIGGNNALGALTTSGTGVTIEGNVTTAGAQTYHDAVTLYGGGTLTLSGTGIDFASTVTAPNWASLVVADNGTTQLGGNVTTGPGAQTYDGPVSLNADAILSGGSVDFASTVNGAYNLTINGVTTLGGAVGNSTALTSLTLDGAATLEGPTITTTGAQNYDGAVTLYGGGTFTLTGTGIDFASTIVAPNRASLVVADSGATTFGGSVGAGAGNALGTLTTSGTGVTIAGNITTMGTQTYHDPVSLYGGGTLTFNGTGIDFMSTIVAPNGANLVVADNGITQLGGNVTTGPGAQTYDGAVSLNANLTLSGSSVDFASTVNGAYSLTVGGTATLGGAVGNITPLTSLTLDNAATLVAPGITTTGAQNYDGAVTIYGGGTLTLTGTGIDLTSTLNAPNGANLVVADMGTTQLGGNVTTGLGSQTYDGPVSLNANLTLSGGSVDFASTVNGPYNLTVIGAATLGGAVGNSTPLASLTLDNAVTLDGPGVTTSGAQNYDGPVTLAGNNTLTGTGIDFASTVTSPNGASLVVADYGVTQLGGNVTTGAGSQTYEGPVSLNANLTLSGGSVDFASTVNGDYTLTVSGVATLGGAVGNTTPLASLTLDNAATLGGPTITTTGPQNYDGAVSLYGGGTLTLAGNDIDFANTIVAPNGASLSVVDSGATTFGGTIGAGAGNALGTLTTSGTGVTIEGNVTTYGAQTYHDPVTLYGGGTLTLTGTGLDFASTVTSPNGASLVVADNGTTQLGGNVNTGPGSQTYDGAVSLNADAILSGSSVDFGSTVNGPYNLTVTGAATLGGAVGNSAPLASLTLENAATLEGLSITTMGSQNYEGPVTLYGGGTLTLTGTGIDFASTIVAPEAASLVVADSGFTTFGGTVGAGAGNALGSLTTSGSLVTVAGNITTLGAQTYNDAVSLYGGGTLTLTGTGIDFMSTIVAPNAANLVVADNGTTQLGGNVNTGPGTQTFDGPVSLNANVTLSGSSVDFASTVNGAYNLTVSGTATLGGALGNTTPLTSLTLDNAVTLEGPTITTTGPQNYDGAVTLYGGGTLTLSGTGIDFANTVTSPNWASLVVADGGTTQLGGNVNTGNGAQTYQGPVSLNANVTLSGGSVDFDSTVNGAYSLTVSGMATLGGAVGNTTPLAALTLDNAAILDGPTITTTGPQNYDGAVTLAGNNTLAGSSIGFDSTVNGAYSLTVSGTATLSGAVGNTTPLTSLTLDDAATLQGPTISTTGPQNYDGAVTLYGGGTLTLSGTGIDFGATVNAPNGANLVVADLGTTQLGGNVTTTGTQTYDGPVSLDADITLSGSTVDFASTVNGAYSLTVSGAATLGGAVGNTAPLTSLTLDNGVTLDGPSVTTTSGQTYEGAVTLAGNNNLTGSSVSFDSTVDGAYSLTVSGLATLSGAVGGMTPLTSLTLENAATLDGLIVTTTGSQTYGGGVTLAGNNSLTGSSVSFDSTVNGAYNLTVSGAATLGGAVGNITALTSLTLDNAATLDGPSVTTTGAQNYDGAVMLAGNTTLTGSSVDLKSTVDGAYSLTVSGLATLGGVVGGSTPLAALTLDNAATLDGPSVTTTGAQNYDGAVTLAGNNTLTGSSVDFASTVNGAYSLTVGGLATLGGAVGEVTPLTSLTLDNAATLDGPSVTTTGTQSYDGAVTLAGNTTLTGSSVDLKSTVDGAYSLTVSGLATLGGAVGATTPLASLTLDNAATLDGPGVTTTGAQVYEGPVTFAGNNLLTASSVSFDSTVNGAYGLTLSGPVTLSGAIGGITPLTSLTLENTATLDGASVTTTGAQIYDGAVTLAGNNTLTGSSVDFASTVNGAYNLTINGTATLGGAVGNLTPLASLTLDDAATLDGPSVTTTGIQSYDGAVTLGGNLTLNSTGSGANGTITFASTINADSTANDRALVINAAITTLSENIGTGTLPGLVGVGNELGTVIINGAIDVSKAPGIIVESTGLQQYGEFSPDIFLTPNVLLANDQNGLTAYSDIAFDLALDEVIKGVFTTLQAKRANTAPIEAEPPPQESGPPLYGEYLMRSGDVQ